MKDKIYIKLLIAQFIDRFSITQIEQAVIS